VFPEFENGGTHVNVSGIALTKAAPNKSDALALMEWLVSPTAQSIYAELNHEFPVLAGAQRSELVASWGEFSVDNLSLTELAKLRPAALKMMEEVNYDG